LKRGETKDEATNQTNKKFTWNWKAAKLNNFGRIEEP
jgi:hypothetical protein